MDIRLLSAVAASHASAAVIRRLGHGGGTALPGLVANWIDPRALAKLSAQLPHGVIVVSGTNGKTTTARAIATIAAAAGYRPVHNRSGSNLVRGVTAAVAAQTRLNGRVCGDLGIFEADEAAFPAIVAQTRPRLVVLLNLFRDQLDRYGELDAIARRWSQALALLPPESCVLVNADDPTLAVMTETLPVPRITFGILEAEEQLPSLPHAADALSCRRCGAALTYRQAFLSHLGEYVCPRCGFTRPRLDYGASEIVLEGLDRLQLRLTIPQGDQIPLAVPLGGLYNAYNVIAAAAAAHTFGITPSAIAQGFAQMTAAFGRLERVCYHGREIIFLLIKNPTGLNEVVRALAKSPEAPLFFAINDLDADGRDISWLWDADLEPLAAWHTSFFTGGLRGPDMALRLKYAGIAETRVHELGRLPEAFERFVARLAPGARGYVLPTYTALLSLRRYLAARGAAPAFWEQ